MSEEALLGVPDLLVPPPGASVFGGTHDQVSGLLPMERPGEDFLLVPGPHMLSVIKHNLSAES